VQYKGLTARVEKQVIQYFEVSANNVDVKTGNCPASEMSLFFDLALLRLY
jgi:hypothetical protein